MFAVIIKEFLHERRRFVNINNKYKNKIQAMKPHSVCFHREQTGWGLPFYKYIKNLNLIIMEVFLNE